MNAVESAARALGKAVQADPRYLAYHAAKNENDSDAALQTAIQDFNLLRMNYQRETERAAEEQNTGKIQKLEQKIQERYLEIWENPHMAAFEAAKQEMDAMMREVDLILTMCANGEDPDTCHPDLSSCTGNCSSCGGCH